MPINIKNSKLETRNSKQARNTKRFDLEDRTLKFAKDTRYFIKHLPKTFLNIEDAKQLLRSSGSIGANYREANDALSKKDFVNRAKISRKESKETIFWLELIETPDDMQQMRLELSQEATELMKIFGTIVRRSE